MRDPVLQNVSKTNVSLPSQRPCYYQNFFSNLFAIQQGCYRTSLPTIELYLPFHLGTTLFITEAC